MTHPHNHIRKCFWNRNKKCSISNLQKPKMPLTTCTRSANSEQKHRLSNVGPCQPPDLENFMGRYQLVQS